MVEINQSRRLSICWRGRSGTDNGRQKNQKSWLWRHCRRRAIYWLPRSPSQTCHAKPKTQINRRRIPASFPLVGCHRKQFGLKDFSPKSQDAVALQQIKERGALPMTDRGDIRQAIDRCSNIHYPRRWRYGQLSTRLTALLAKFKEAGGTVREIDVWAESPRLSPLWLSASSACHGLLIITVITPLPTKPSATKSQRTEAGERGNYWHADASAWCCCARCKIHEGVSWC